MKPIPTPTESDAAAAAFKEVRQILKEDFDHVDALIISNLESSVASATEIGSHILLAGGKRLRPMVSLLVARTMGSQSRTAITLAVLLEFLHTATLLHDDVVDDSDLRRGRPTANALWGNSPSIIVGDFLYSRAFQLMVELGRMDVMETLSNATNLIAEGEVRQFENIGNPDLSEAEYMEVIRSKSAVLFEASAETGARLANVHAEDIENARLFGLHFGLAYQLMDDLLDYAGDTQELGKNIGDDLAEGKTTLPLIFAMRNCNDLERGFLRQVIKDRQCENPHQVIEIIHRSGALGFVRTNALAQTNLAKHSLYKMPPNRYRDGLEKLADTALSRIS